MGFYKKYAVLGLCGNCGKQPRSNKTTCESCYAKKSLYDQRRKTLLRSSKICTSCAKKPALEGVLCGNCQRKQYQSSLEWPSNNPDYQMNNYLIKKYGISLEDKKDLLKKQGYKCAICGKSVDVSSHLDHDHLTNKVRGILCSPCNLALGLVHDSEEILLDMVFYIRKYR
jgi:DNA-directed RNA polymerase subunit RPC12/RpoP